MYEHAGACFEVNNRKSPEINNLGLEIIGRSMYMNDDNQEIFLILGGNGYLGSKVVFELLKMGKKCICTKRELSDLSRLHKLIDNEHKNNLQFINADINSVCNLLEENRVDWFINMSCNYGRSNVLYDSVIESNIEFPLKVLNYVVESGTKNILTIGTGLPDEFNMYSFSKKMFSMFGEFYVKKHNINFINMKLEMFYGYDEPAERFIPSLVHKMLNGETINVTLGTQRRDIISVDDVVYAIISATKADLKGYNRVPVGTGVAPKIREIVNYIWITTGKKSVVNYGAIPMRIDEPDCVADTHFISQVCEWTPIEWTNGLKIMIDNIKKNQNK